MNRSENTLAQRFRASGQIRRPALILASLILLAAAIGAGVYWMLVARYYEDTDDAYVGGHVVQITPQVGGTVVAVGADDTDVVAPGQMLVRLDPADSRIELAQSEAQLAQAVRQTRTLYANNDVLQANVALREAELARAQDDLARRRSVAGTGAVSREEIRHAELAVAAAEAALQSAREQLRSNLSYTAGTSLEKHPNVLAAAARVRDAFLTARRGEIVAPVGGQIAKRAVQVGQRVQPGAPLMAVIPLDDLWVDANFKEVQLGSMRIGQPVTLTADVYGSSARFHGRVAGLGAGTGSAFALLPAQNATGNWIKVVQRVPVRIELDPAEVKQHPLRVGLSMRVTVDVHDTRGSPVAAHTVAAAGGSSAATPMPVANVDRTDVYDGFEHEADALVDRIIVKNGGHAIASSGSGLKLVHR